MKKILIIASIIILVLIASYLAFMFLGDVTISFNSNGGSEITALTIKKNRKTALPIPTKENNIFLGWYLNDTIVDDNHRYSKDTILNAKWKDYYTITFNSNGGSSIDNINIKCGEELTLPESIPVKEGFNFMSWVDQNERAILDKALLSCNDITLYAYWIKK